MTPIGSSPSFLDLPPELRNRIYREYFSLHRGHMHIKMGTTTQNGRISSMIHEMNMNMHISSTQSATDVPSSAIIACSNGPATLLMASKLIFNEAFAMFLHSTTFSLSNPKTVFHFMRRHDSGMLRNLRSIIIDQTKGFSQHDLRFMVKMLKFHDTLSSLSRLIMHIDSGSDWFWRKEFPRIEKALLEPGLFGSIKADAIYIIDPSLNPHFAREANFLTRVLTGAAHSEVLADMIATLKLDLLTAGVRVRHIDEQHKALSGSTDGNEQSNGR